MYESVILFCSVLNPDPNPENSPDLDPVLSCSDPEPGQKIKKLPDHLNIKSFKQVI